jgi:hypothetical protein
VNLKVLGTRRRGQVTFVNAKRDHRVTSDHLRRQKGPQSVGLSLVPLALAVLGAAIPLVGSAFSVWGMALIWLAAIAIVTLVRAVVQPEPSTRVFLDLVGLVMTLVILAPEGGWWFVPAVVAQLLLDRRTALSTPRTG